MPYWCNGSTCRPAECVAGGGSSILSFGSSLPWRRSKIDFILSKKLDSWKDNRRFRCVVVRSINWDMMVSPYNNNHHQRPQACVAVSLQGPTPDVAFHKEGRKWVLSGVPSLSENCLIGKTKIPVINK